MKSLFKVAGIILVALFAVSMFASATASAAPHWLVCTEGGTATKYETNQCSTASSGGKWQWNELTGTESAKTAGSLLLKDTGALVSSSVECYGESNGSAGPGKFGRVNEITVTPAQCHGIKMCQKVEKIKAVHLPWQTELYETEGKISETLSNAGNGEPGWEVECKVTGTTFVNDLCEQETGKPESIGLENLATGSVLLVLGTFQHLRKAKCSAGGAEKGEVQGSLAGFRPSGGLRVSK